MQNKMLGAMIDCSRNAVMKPDIIKKYADILKKMGYNTILLYIEDTYEIDENPYFGYMRGRYTKNELKDIDTYLNSIGMEFIPCIQTLAHLENIFRWREEYDDIRDCDDILLAGEDKTYNLIDNMFKTISECFTSKKVHIGMDEAYRVGTGKYLKKHGIKDRFEIINTHLHRVCEIADRYKFETFIWSDMFCRLALDIDDQYADADKDLIMDKSALPDNVSLVYWDYMSTDYNHYADMIKRNQSFGRKTYFAGGMHTWSRISPDNTYSIEATNAAVKACNDCKTDGMFFTAWGDDGSECSKFSALPSFMYAAEAVKGNTDIQSIKSKFRDITGYEFDTFMLLDKFDKIGGKHSENPSKYLLYNDIFLGLRDYLCADDDGIYYRELRDEIHNKKGNGEFDYLFDEYEKLADVLQIKATLGIRTRKAYKGKNIEELKKIAADCNIAIEKINSFHKAFEKLWFMENKPFGFEIQDMRLGGLMKRLESCMKRIEEYAEGKTDEIAELEETRLNTQINECNQWSRIISPCNVEVYIG